MHYCFTWYCIVIFSSLLCVRSVFLSSPRPSKRRNRPVSLDPKSLSLAELNALPRNSLILLPSAQNLVTTDTKTRLTQCVYEHERANSNQTQVTDPRRPAPPTSNVTPEVSTDADPPLRSPDLQQPSSGLLFWHDQLSQLCKIIADVIGPQWTDPDQAPGLPTDVPPLSHASGLNSILNNTSGRSHTASHILSKMAQGVTKVLSNSPGLVKWLVGLVFSYHSLPDGQTPLVPLFWW